MGRVVVVGGGIIGSMHAWMAIRRGDQMVQLERDAEARGASVRNFGLVWVSGRAPGPELDLARRSRELWDEVARDAPGVGLRADGSVTVAASPEEVAVLEEAAYGRDAGARGWRLRTAEEVRQLNPAVQGKVLAGLECSLDATAEPRRAAAAIRHSLAQDRRYAWLPGRTVLECGSRWVRDHTGARHDADRVVLCCGADHQGLAAPALLGAPLRRVRLHMMETAPYRPRLTTSLADGDSLRHYPAYRSLPALGRLPRQDALSADYGIQLLLVQRLDGSLTIGDSHEYDEPFDFALRQEVADEVVRRASAVIGGPLPAVTRRWAGVYSQVTDESMYLRRQLAPGVDVVTGPGGRGMTLSAAIAEETFA